eukprot:CAMPEP_0117450054 /NCGR_PEP_ID=MMETSP0759-20121206/8266_1 /TAXON_ID=63605 /ORGANISM="Percolomonas cosmopolitus, Strain WS" /LENGTH=1296 /DNA_ID=CAMNT_0005242555 /DNA_START=565 /DNA_END=4455 /DNA_ORIENTATION=-
MSPSASSGTSLNNGRGVVNSSPQPQDSSEDDLSPQPSSSASSSTPSSSPMERSSDPEHAARLLLLYIKSYHSHLVHKTLCLNPATLRYIAARIREMKRAPPNARFSILDFFRSSDELSSYDFVQIENSFKELRKIALLGKNEVTELDLRYFLNLNSLRISKCDVVYVSEPDEWFAYQMHRLQDVRIIRGKMSLSAMRSVPYKLKTVESVLSWDTISEKWIRFLQDIECIRCKLGQLASLLVPQIAMKVTSTDDPTQQQGGNTDDESTDHSSNHSITTTGWQELSRLVVTQNNIRHLDQSLSFCPNLEHLDLRNNQIENLDASMISRPLTKLDTVILRNNFLDSLQFSRNLLEHVRLLDISHNHLTTISGIENAVNLKELDVSHNSLIDWSDVKRLKKLFKLQTLNLHHNPDLEQHEDYRGLVAGMFVGRSQGFMLDGKPVSRWEAKSNATLASSSSDSEDDTTNRSSFGALKVSTTTQQTDWAQAVLTPVLVTPATPLSAKKLKKKSRRRVRKVTEIPEFKTNSKLSTITENGFREKESDQTTSSGVPTLQVTTPDASPSPSSVVQDSEEFFKHMSHFYENADSSGESKDGTLITGNGEEPSKSTISIEKLNKNVEWTKEHLSTIREDGGDNWLLLLNEYMHPEQKKRRKLAQKDKKSTNSQSEALKANNSSISTVRSLNTSSGNIVSEKEVLRSDDGTRYAPVVSLSTHPTADRIPSFRRPVASTKIIVDYSNTLITEDFSSSSSILRRQRTSARNSLFCLDQDRVKRETYDFLKELNLENEIGLGLQHDMNSDDHDNAQPNPETSLSLSEMISDTSSMEEDTHSAFDSIKHMDAISEQSDDDHHGSSDRIPPPSDLTSASDENQSIFEETASDSSEESESGVEEDKDTPPPEFSPLPPSTTAVEPDDELSNLPSSPQKDNLSQLENLHRSTENLDSELPPQDTDQPTTPPSSEPEPVRYSSSYATGVTFSEATSESGDDEQDPISPPSEPEENVDKEQDSDSEEVQSTKDEDEKGDDSSSAQFDEDTETSQSFNTRNSTTLERVIEESMKKTKLILSGYLIKEGGVWKSWKRRYFKLTEKYWIYGKDQNDTIDVIDTCHIQSISCTVHRKALKKYQKFGFIVDVGGEINRTYKVCAESEEQQMKWVRALTSLMKGAKENDRSAPSMLTATNSNCFRLRHIKSGLIMDCSSTGKLVFTRESSGNHIRWRYIGGRITNENLGTVLVAESDGTCRLMSLDKNPGSESFWKAIGQFVVNFNGHCLTVSREWQQKSVNIVGFVQEKDKASVHQLFEVIQ